MVQQDSIPGLILLISISTKIFVYSFVIYLYINSLFGFVFVIVFLQLFKIVFFPSKKKEEIKKNIAPEKQLTAECKVLFIVVSSHSIS